MAADAGGERVILALDQGTTSSRALVIARDGRVLGSAQREIHSLYPRPGWVELDPLEIWESQRQTAVEALRRSGVAAAQVVEERARGVGGVGHVQTSAGELP